MKIEERTRQESGLFKQGVVDIKITEVRKEDATGLFNALRHTMHWNTGQRLRYQLTVTGNGIDVSEVFESRTDLHRFLFGYELALQMNGIDVRKSW